MDEKPPAFTVTDRRKFTVEGDRREEVPLSEPEDSASKASDSGARVFTMPSPKLEEPAAAEGHAVAEPQAATEQEATEPVEALEAGPSAQEVADQHTAYQQSSQSIDTMLRQANPGIEDAPQTGFDHVVQSIYLSAMMALGAGTEQGQQPRIDIIGARQSIDMLTVLQEKTKGNLTEKEQRLLQNALFDLRMTFIEITNAIAQSAQRPPDGRK